MSISRLLSRFAPNIKSGNSLFSGLSLGGQLDTGSTGQIKFPTIKNPSNDPNTLDDYEEGTFTAYFAGNTSGTPMFNGVNPYGLIYNAANGLYSKIGSVVSVYAYIKMLDVYSYVNGFTSSTAQFISGLPYAPVGGG